MLRLKSSGIGGDSSGIQIMNTQLPDTQILDTFDLWTL